MTSNDKRELAMFQLLLVKLARRILATGSRDEVLAICRAMQALDRALEAGKEKV